MQVISRWIETSRVWVLLLTLPQAAMWASVRGSGGGWMVVAHSLLVLIYFLSLDLAFSHSGHAPRFALVRDRFRLNPSTSSAIRSSALLLFVVTCLGLLVAETGLGVFAVAAALLIILRADASVAAPGSRRFIIAELVLPAAIIVLPALLIGSWEWGRQLDATEGHRLASAVARRGEGVMGPEIVGSAVAGALLLGTWVLLCLIRDACADEHEDSVTTVTLLGQEWAISYAVLWLAGTVAWTAYGVGSGWWGRGGWLIGAIIAVAALLVVLALARVRCSRAAGLWFTSSAVASVLMGAGVLGTHTVPDVPEATITSPAPTTGSEPPAGSPDQP